jgi:hypothetical protein
MNKKTTEPQFTGRKRSVADMLGLTAGRVVAAVAIVVVVTTAVVAWAQMKLTFGYETTCASNLRQLGTAMLQYAQDNDQKLPCPGGKTIGSWNDVDEDGFSPVLDPYLSKLHQQARLQWACPTPIAHPLRLPARDDENNFLRYPRTYAMNTYLRSPGSRCLIK